MHTHLRNEPLTRDDLVDLALLRLDLVAAIGLQPDGRPADLHVAHLLPPLPGQPPWRILPSEPFHHSTLDAVALTESLEEEFERVAPAAVATDTRTRALLVVVDLRRRRPGAPPSAASEAADPGGRVVELRELCRTANVRVSGVMEQRRHEADPKYLVGRGKLEEILIRAMQVDADALIFDPDLTPVQAHAIADFTDLKVIDRTMLILDIFAQRAKSRDGKLQVELAQLRYRAAAAAREEHHDVPPHRRHRRSRPRRDEAGGATAAARASGSTGWRRRSTASASSAAGRRAERGARAAADRRHRRLHQRRQVDAAQHADRQRRAGRGQAVRHARSDHAGGCGSRASARSS